MTPDMANDPAVLAVLAVGAWLLFACVRLWVKS